MNSTTSYVSTFTKNLKKYTFNQNLKLLAKNHQYKKIYLMSYSINLVSQQKKAKKLIPKLFWK